MMANDYDVPYKKQIKCPLCNGVYASYQALNSHLEKHHIGIPGGERHSTFHGITTTYKTYDRKVVNKLLRESKDSRNADENLTKKRNNNRNIEKGLFKEENKIYH